MNVLYKAAKEANCHPFDIVLDSIEKEVPEDLHPFINGHQVMESIRHSGDVPKFVERHARVVMAEAHQLALL